MAAKEEWVGAKVGVKVENLRITWRHGRVTCHRYEERKLAFIGKKARNLHNFDSTYKDKLCNWIIHRNRAIAGLTESLLKKLRHAAVRAAFCGL